MKDNWLLLSLILISAGFFNDFRIRLLMSAVWLVLLPHIVNRDVHKRIVLAILLFIVASIPIKSKIDQGRVIQVRKQYQIISNGISSIIVYSDDNNVCIDDLVEVDCELEEIDSYDNFDTTTFKDWSFSQKIYYQGKIDNYKINKKATSFRSTLYQLNKGTWINQLLFGSGNQLESSYSYLLTSSGMHISFFIGLIRKLLSFNYYPEDSLKKSINIVFVLGLVFKFPYALIRVLLSLLAELFFDNKRERAGWLACMLCLYRPYVIKSTTFMVPIVLRFISLFVDKHRLLVTQFAMIIIQLYFYGNCDLGGILTFQLFRSAVGVLYACAIVLAIFPIKFTLPVDLIISLREKVPKFEIHGQIKIWIILLIVWALRQYLKGERKCNLILACVCLLFNHYQSIFNFYYQVNYLDVGQGDCAVIMFPFSFKALLIDTGGNHHKDIGSDLVIPFLKRQGLASVDVVISHDDYDHCGALETIQKELNVKNIYDSKQHDIEVNGLRIETLLREYEFDNSNDNSLINYFSIDKFAFLFLGDVSSDVEEILVNKYQNLPVSVLKVAHHGSKTSTSEKLLSNYHINYAIISAGRNNSYGHPHVQTIQNLEAYGVRVLNTQQHHAVKIVVLRHFLLLYTASGLFIACKVK